MVDVDGCRWVGLAGVGLVIGSTIAGVCAAGGVGRVGFGSSVFGSTFCTGLADSAVMPPLFTPGAPVEKLISMTDSCGRRGPNSQDPARIPTIARLCAIADTSIILRSPSGSRERATMVLETRSEVIAMTARSASIRRRS